MKRFIIFICALFMFGATNAATLNFRHNDTITKIELDTIKRTNPALATQIDGTVYYANLKPATERVSNNAYITYGGNIYEIQDNYKYPFSITTIDMPAGTEFTFMMSAAGKFIVDWGDGDTEQIDRTDNTDFNTHSHTYTAAGVRTIKFGGRATEYSTAKWHNAIDFSFNGNIAGIFGSLGAIFPTIGNGGTLTTQPRFDYLFGECFSLTGNIPENLFDGIKGQPVESMFAGLFSDTYITGEIPEKLFADIKGVPTAYMFDMTFRDCPRLTGKIPENLFAGISGTPAEYMFSATFEGCPGLTGEIPEKLFRGIYGPAQKDMFAETFLGCTGLTGPSAKINGKYLYEIWPDATESQVGKCYREATGLSDYDDIPDAWK